MNYLFASNLSPSGCSHAVALFANKEQVIRKKVWLMSYLTLLIHILALFMTLLIHILAVFMTSVIQTAGHKMAALSVVFSRHPTSNVKKRTRHGVTNCCVNEPFLVIGSVVLIRSISPLRLFKIKPC